MGKNKKVEKATKSDKRAVDAVKGKKAKLVAEPAAPKLHVVSEYAVEGEKPEWNDQLDELQRLDSDAGMSRKAMRVQRQQRVRQLLKGKSLPDHGGLFDLDAVQGEPQQPEVEVVEPAEEFPPVLSKKQRKALDKVMAQELKQAQKEAEVAALRQQTELAEAAAAEAAELERRNAALAVPVKPKKAKAVSAVDNVPESYGDPTDAPVPSNPLQAETPTRTRTDMIRKALDEAVAARDETGERQVIELPREYKVKNYQAQLIRKYGEDFPGLTGKEIFNEETGLFKITLFLPAAPTTRSISGGPNVGEFVVSAKDAAKIGKKELAKLNKKKSKK